MAIREKRSINMTEGALLGKIILFVLPMMLTNLLQVFYGAADMMIVSLSPEQDAVGAIGTTGAFLNLVLNLFIGFSVGANIIIARHVGAKDGDSASKAVHTAIIIGVLLGLVGGGVGMLIARPILTAMGAEGKLLELAVTYTMFYFAGTPFVALTNFLVSIFRAKGDTKTPLYVLSFTGIINVFLNIFFVLVCSLSVEGVALATLISNAVSSVILLLRLARDDSPCAFSFRKLRIDRRAMRDIVRLGIPAGIQGALFSLSNLIIQSSILKVNNIIAPEGAEFQPVVKANAAVGNLENFVYTATNSVAQASVTFTSQNIGARKPERVWKIMGNCYFVSMTVAIICTSLLIGFNHQLLSLYGVVDGAEGSLAHIAYESAMIRLYFCTAPYLLLAFMEVGSCVLRGLGRSMTSTVISLVGSCLLRIVWIYTVFASLLTLESVYISYPISWALTGSVHLIFAAVILKKLIREKNSSSQST